MTVTSLLDEYNLTLDDVRWYLSVRLAESLLTERDAPEAIAGRIWSGRLEADLYNMEEAFLGRLQDELNRGLTDSHAVRDQLEAARILKLRRRRA
jgi:hypothetical protein